MRASPCRLRLAPAVLPIALLLAGCAGTATSPVASASPPGEPVSASPSTSGTVTIYSGRSEALVGPLIERFEQASGVEVRVNYASTTDLAATILEEGDASPADVFFSQDAGALGALAAEGRLARLPASTLERVEPRFRSPDDLWVGVSGRARVVAYDSRALSADDLPDGIDGFTDPSWKSRLGWAPGNASFQAFVTAYRVLEGEEAARAWLEGIQANEPKVYEGNSQALEGVASGEIQAAFVNHYYALQQAAEQGADYPVRNHFFPPAGAATDDPGSLVNVAGAAVLDTTANPEAALAFVDFLLTDESQAYFADETYEYPLVTGVPADERLPALADLQSPEIDLSELADLEGTLRLLQEVGIL